MPLITRPHLLTFLLGAEYVKSNPKFKKVWEEVDTQRTMHELLEVEHPTVPFDARMELVITGNDISFLSAFRHKRLARAVLHDGLMIKVGGSFVYYVYDSKGIRITAYNWWRIKFEP